MYNISISSILANGLEWVTLDEAVCSAIGIISEAINYLTTFYTPSVSQSKTHVHKYMYMYMWRYHGHS